MMEEYNISKETIESNLRYLQLLAKSFPNVAEASTEIINLEAILNLPKGTEHFLTDIHGEYEAFRHVLKNASGAVKRKVNEIFGHTMRESEKKDLCTLIYYPEEKLEQIKTMEPDMEDWYNITLNKLIRVCQNVSSKYTRSKVHKAMPRELSYTIQELMHESSIEPNKQAYTNVIISTIISTQRADDFIIAMCNLIQRLTIDQLHIVGDIYDRGPGAHHIMDILRDYHNVDIQWGNHDILWMGAAAGNRANIANVIRIAMRYGTQSTLEDGYGINLLPLATFAMEHYADDDCEMFVPKIDLLEMSMAEKTLKMLSQMHKAITIIQFKLEAEIIRNRPEFEMEDRLLLDKIDFEKGVCVIDGTEYEMLDKNFPTVDPSDPFKLTDEEEQLISQLEHSFRHSEKLKKHMKCLLNRGSLYSICNSNLLFHASIPLNEDGSFKEVKIMNETFKGKALLDRVDQLIRMSFNGDSSEEGKFALDYIWYLWCGKDAPPFDKAKMATFERYFLAGKPEIRAEKKGYYYSLRNNEEVCDMILDEFKVEGSHRHIINGHVPVKIIKGENPIKANGKLLVIDGGFSKAYQPETGIAGYTLVYHSHGMQLVQHEPFQSTKKAILEGLDIKSTTFVIEFNTQRMMVKDTDKGKVLREQITDLRMLLDAYRMGLIKEKSKKNV